MRVTAHLNALNEGLVCILGDVILHVSFCASWLICMCAMVHSYVCNALFVYIYDPVQPTKVWAHVSHIYECLSLNINGYTHTYIYTYECMYISMYIHVNKCICMHIYIYMYMYTYVCKNIYVDTYIYVHIHI